MDVLALINELDISFLAVSGEVIGEVVLFTPVFFTVLECVSESVDFVIALLHVYYILYKVCLQLLKC